MARPRLWLTALAGVAAAAAASRRRRARGREEVEVTYGDGSKLTFETGEPAAAELLDLARRALRTAGTGR